MPRDARGREYNKELREQIKDAGRELINRAEEIVSPNTEGIVSLDIHFSFLQGVEEMPTMSYTMQVVGKNTLERWNHESNVNKPNCRNCQYLYTNPLKDPCLSCFDGNNFLEKKRTPFQSKETRKREEK